MGCIFCGGNSFSEVLTVKGIAMNSDSSVSNADFTKIMCKHCELVQSRNIDSSFLKKYYQKDYSFNTKNDVFEHILFTGEKAVDQSEAYIEMWMKPNIDFNAVNSVLEIGCGKGTFIKMLKRAFPHLEVYGLEPSTQAAELAKKTGCTVYNTFLEDDTLRGRKFDLVIAICILEHVSQPLSFLRNMARLCKTGGVVGLIIPNAECIFYDAFFVDHIYHFTSAHIAGLMIKAGIPAEKMIIKAPPFQEFLFAVGRKGRAAAAPIQKIKTGVIESIKFYRKIFDFLDETLNELKEEKTAVYGLSEVFSLFRCYSEKFRTFSPQIYIDDSPLLDGTSIDSKPIQPLTAAVLDDIDNLIVAMNGEYYKRIETKLREHRYMGNIIFPMDLITK